MCVWVLFLILHRREEKGWEVETEKGERGKRGRSANRKVERQKEAEVEKKRKRKRKTHRKGNVIQRDKGEGALERDDQ